MKVAALDLGTNSFLCLIAEVERGTPLQILSDQVEIVRLGQGVHQTKAFHPEALVRTRACLEKFKKTIDIYQPRRVLAVATSAARDVTNSEELFRIGNDLGIPIEIISGDKEAEITFKGSTSGISRDGRVRVVIDIGGGSTEIISGKDGLVLDGGSVDIGGLRLTEKFFPTQPPTSQQLEKTQEYIRQQLRSVIEKIKTQNPFELVAVGGNPTELASVMLGGFDNQKIDGLCLTGHEIRSWRQRFECTSPAQRIEKFHVSKGRADIILSGVLILETILDMLSLRQVTVSTRGVRFGVALELSERG